MTDNSSTKPDAAGDPPSDPAGAAFARILAELRETRQAAEDVIVRVGRLEAEVRGFSRSPLAPPLPPLPIPIPPPTPALPAPAVSDEEIPLATLLESPPPTASGGLAEALAGPDSAPPPVPLEVRLRDGTTCSGTYVRHNAQSLRVRMPGGAELDFQWKEIHPAFVERILARVDVSAAPPQTAVGAAGVVAAVRRFPDAPQGAPPSRAAGVSPVPLKGAAPAPAAAGGFEAVFGGRWLNRAGIVTLLIAAVFVLKYAYDKNYISPAVRAVIGIAAGAAFIAWGQVCRRKTPVLAQGFLGLGVGIMYATIFVAHSYHNLFGLTGAFGGMAGVALLAVALAVAYDSIGVAALGLFGGFLTPILLRSGQDHQIPLFLYMAGLNATVLVLVGWRGWRRLSYLGILGTLLLSVGWSQAFYKPEKAVLTWSLATLEFAFYFLQPLALLLGRRLPAAREDLLTAALSLIYVPVSMFLLRDAGSEWQGAWMIVLAAAYFGVSLAVGRDEDLSRLLLGIALLIGAGFAPVQYSGPAVTRAWSVTVAVYAGLAFWRGGNILPGGTAVLGLVALTRLIGFDTPDHLYDLDPYRPVFNIRTLTYALLAAGLLPARFLFFALPRAPSSEEPKGPAPRAAGVGWDAILQLALHALALVWLSLEVAQFVDDCMGRAASPALAANRRLSWMAISWCIYGMAGAQAGARTQRILLRGVGMILLAAGWMTFASVQVVEHVGERTAVLNVRFLQGLMVAASAFGTAALGRPAGAGRDPILRLTALFVGHLLLLGLFSLEVVDWCAAHRLETRGGAAVAVLHYRSMMLATLWALFGLTLTLGGSAGEDSALRWIGLRLEGAARWLRGFGATVLALGGVLFLATQVNSYCDEPTRLLNPRFIEGLVLALACFVASRCWTDESPGGGRGVRLFFLMAGHAAVLTLLSLEVNDYYDGRRAQFRGDMDQLFYGKQMALSVVWALYAVALVGGGFVRRHAVLRWSGLSLLILCILKVFVLDLNFLKGLPRILSFAALGGILVGVSYLYQRFKDRLFAAEPPTDAPKVPGAGGEGTG